MLLTECEKGTVYILESVRTGDKMRSRLYSMGILPGARIKIYDRTRGAVAVFVCGQRAVYALGERLAEKIYASEDGDERLKDKSFNHGFAAFEVFNFDFAFAKPATIPDERKLSQSESHGHKDEI